MNKVLQLGNTNIEVNSIGLGAMPLSLVNRPNSKQAHLVIEEFINNGGNFIDTANVYCADESEIGHNEILIEKILLELNQKHNIYIATKGGIERKKNDWIANGRPEFLRQSCEKSLRDLKTDSIFLYQLHAPDPDVPLTESIGELLVLRNEGKIQHIGLSNVNIEQIQLAMSITQIMSVQNRCNLFNRKSFIDGVVDFCHKNEITFIAHSPVGGHFEHKQLTENSILRKLAKKYSVSPYQIMLAWLLSRKQPILTIPGASKQSSISDSMQAISLKLNQSDIQLLDSIN